MLTSPYNNCISNTSNQITSINCVLTNNGVITTTAYVILTVAVSSPCTAEIDRDSHFRAFSSIHPYTASTV